MMRRSNRIHWLVVLIVAVLGSPVLTVVVKKWVWKEAPAHEVTADALPGKPLQPLDVYPAVLADLSRLPPDVRGRTRYLSAVGMFNRGEKEAEGVRAALGTIDPTAGRVEPMGGLPGVWRVTLHSDTALAGWDKVGSGDTQLLGPVAGTLPAVRAAAEQVAARSDSPVPVVSAEQYLRSLPSPAPAVSGFLATYAEGPVTTDQVAAELGCSAEAVRQAVTVNARLEPLAPLAAGQTVRRAQLHVRSGASSLYQVLAAEVGVGVPRLVLQ